MPRSKESDPVGFIQQDERYGEQGKPNSVQQVERMVRLLKKGDASSLARIRQELGKPRQEVALKIGVSEQRLEQWEEGEKLPSGKHNTQWKLKLSYYVDEVISDLLGTENAEVNTQFLEVMWGLVD